MKKLLSIILCIMLILTIGAPVLAAPPSMYLSRDSYAYAVAGWEIGSWDDPDNYIAYEVVIENTGRNNTTLCYTEYRLEYYEYEPGYGEYWWVAVDNFCQQLNQDQFSLTKKTIKNDLVVDLETERGPIHLMWKVLDSYDFNSKVIERFDGTSIHMNQRGTESSCSVEGSIFGLELNSSTTTSNYGYMVVARSMQKSMTK